MFKSGRGKFYGFTLVFSLICIWIPPLYFISAARKVYKMESFEIFEMDWVAILIFLLLCVATLIAQFGLAAIDNALAEFELLKQRLETLEDND